MVVTLESVQKNEELYKGYVEKETQELSELMKKLVELKMTIQQNSSEKDIAILNFEEAKLQQELNQINISLKEDELTLMVIELQKKALQGEIDQITFSNKSVATKKVREKLEKEKELVYCKDETNKCEKAIEACTLMGDNEKIEEWQEKLEKAKRDLKFAKEAMGLEQEPTEPIKKEEKKKEEQKKEKMENGIDVTTINDEDKTTTIKSINGVEICSEVSCKDGSYENKSRNIIKDGEKDDFGRTITLSENYCNFTAYQMKYDEKLKTFTEKSINPLVDNTGKVIGQKQATEVSNVEGQKKINVHEELEDYKGTYSIETLIEGIGDQYKEQRNMIVDNKISGSIEKVQYTKDEQGRETYTYMENGTLCEKIMKTSKGTTMEIYKDGQIYDIYEYDENGKALIPRGKMQKLPENYVEAAFSNVIPEYNIISHKVPEELLSQENSSKKQPQSFKESMKFDIKKEKYDEILRRHQEAEEQFEEDLANNPYRKEFAQTEYGVD